MKDKVLNDVITRNDLIDYAISKRVEEVKVRRDAAHAIYNSENDISNKKIESLRKNIAKIRKNEMLAYIDANYSETIKNIELNLDCKVIISDPDTRDSQIDELRYMLRLKKEDILLVFTSVSIKNPRMKMYHHPMDFMVGIESFIRVSGSNIKSAKIDNIEREINELKKNVSTLLKVVEGLDNEIKQIKSQKDVIKNSLIEQVLSSTSEGQNLLDILNNLDLSQKLLK